jgi:hypothetical protein
MSSTTTFTYTTDLIPQFGTGDVATSKWKSLVDNTEVELLQHYTILDHFNIILSPSTLYSFYDSFHAVKRDGISSTYTSSDLFTVKKITIKVNESLSKYVRLLSIGVSTNAAGDAYTDFLLTKESDTLYSVNLTVNTHADTDEDKRFRLYMDCIPIPYKTYVDEDGVEVTEGGFDQIQVFNDLTQTHFFSLQWSGNYVVQNETSENKNRLESGYLVKVQEYSRLLSIFENDPSVEDNQHSMIHLKDVKYSVYRRPLAGGDIRTYKMRTYVLGEGELIDAVIKADITQSADGQKISYLKITGGEIVSHKAVKSTLEDDNADNTEKVISFILYVDESDQSKLPNVKSNIVHVYLGGGTAEDYGVTVSFSNPL